MQKENETGHVLPYLSLSLSFSTENYSSISIHPNRVFDIERLCAFNVLYCWLDARRWLPPVMECNTHFIVTFQQSIEWRDWKEKRKHSNTADNNRQPEKCHFRRDAFIHSDIFPIPTNDKLHVHAKWVEQGAAHSKKKSECVGVNLPPSISINTFFFCYSFYSESGVWSLE